MAPGMFKREAIFMILLPAGMILLSLVLALIGSRILR